MTASAGKTLDRPILSTSLSLLSYFNHTTQQNHHSVKHPTINRSHIPTTNHTTRNIAPISLHPKSYNQSSKHITDRQSNIQPNNNFIKSHDRYIQHPTSTFATYIRISCEVITSNLTPTISS